jgi:hypothetical protein
VCGVGVGGASLCALTPATPSCSLAAPAPPAPQPDWKTLSAAVRKFYGSSGGGGGGVDWVRLGVDVGPLCLDAPVLRFMFGPLGVPVPERKKKAQDPAAAAEAAKRRKEKGELEKVPLGSVQEVEQDDLQQHEAVGSKRSLEIREVLLPLFAKHAARLRCTDGRVRRLVPLIPSLFDPWSYTTTVENLFYFSYLARDESAGVYMAVPPAAAAGAGGSSAAAAAGGAGKPQPHIMLLDDEEWKARLRLRSNNQPVVDYGSDDEAADNDAEAGAGAGSSSAAAPPGSASKRGSAAALSAAKAPARGGESVSNQFILNIDPESWRKICAAYGLQRPVLPHRKTRDTAAPAGFRFWTDDDAARVVQAAHKRQAEIQRKGKANKGNNEEDGGSDDDGAAAASPAAAGSKRKR